MMMMMMMTMVMVMMMIVLDIWSEITRMTEFLTLPFK